MGTVSALRRHAKEADASRKALTSVPADPYEPTAHEAKVVAAIAKNGETRQRLPRMKVEVTGDTAHVAVDHPDRTVGYALIASGIALGDIDFLNGLLVDLGNAATKPGTLDGSLLNYAISIVAGIQPKDHVEALLASQMAAVQIATMSMASRLGSATSRDNRAVSEKAFSRLARTFAAQVEALKRYRSKGEQRVYVERVNVSEGGKAIVGNVTHGGGGGEESDR